MPKKNAIKVYGEGEYYHLYNRGAGKTEIFKEEVDYGHMLFLLKSYLIPGKVVRRDGRAIPNYADKIQLVAYCLMPNHYHFMVYLNSSDGVEKLMRSLMTSYSMYFNKKYKRSGTLFEGIFLASRVGTNLYYHQLSRYIHLNPLDLGRDYMTYPYSSLRYYLGEGNAAWVHPEHILNPAISEEREKYRSEMVAHEDWHKEVHRLKHVLANTE